MKQTVTRTVLYLLCLCCLLTGCAQASAPAYAEASAAPASTAAPRPETPSPSPSPVPTPDPAMEPYCIAWISDTQGYAAAHPETFNAMTRWIVENRDAYHIQYVVHTGDIVDVPTDQKQWDRAAEAMNAFIGKLPVFAVAGNHDIGGINHNYKWFHALMERQNYTAYPTFGGEEEKGRRRYDLLTIGGEKFILIGAGYITGKAYYEWIRNVLTEHADRTAILAVHWYLDIDGTLNSRSGDGWNIYRRIVKANPNIRYVLCGHKHSVKHAVQEIDVDEDRKTDYTVYALMGDYQGYEDGGLGYITLLTFDPASRELRVTAYSPLLDDFNYNEDESKETFTFPFVTYRD